MHILHIDTFSVQLVHLVQNTNKPKECQQLEINSLKNLEKWKEVFKIGTLSEQIPSKEPSENSTNKGKDDRTEDLRNANSSLNLKHQVNILSREIDNKNKKIK